MEAFSHLSIPLSITPTPSLLEDDQIRDHFPSTGPEPDYPDELELSSLIHTSLSGSSNLMDTEEPCQNTTTPSTDDDGQPATGAVDTDMPNEISFPVPSASRPTFCWLSETGCLVVAIAALIATVVILAKFDNQEQPHWPYANMLNLSALIAILATLSRSMVTLILESLIGQLKWYWYGRAHPVVHLQVFDEASHGAWGSSKFLFQIHETGWPSVSAIFMVLSIGIGTFTQLALRTTPCSKAVPHAVASIPTTNMFFATDLETVPIRSGSSSVTYGIPTIDVSTKTAIINGLSGLQSLGAVSASCDTGNCSFPSYDNITHSTLGIESICVDVSPFLIQTDNSTISPGNRSSAHVDGFDDTFVWTNYTLPRDSQFISYLASDDQLGGQGRWWPMLSFSDAGWILLGSSLEQLEYNIQNYEISTGLSPQEKYLVTRSFYQKTIMIPTLSPCLERSAYPPTADPLPLINISSCPQLGMTNVSTFPGFFTLAAVQCHLYPSIRHYSGSVVNGQIQEALVGEPVPLNYGTNATNTAVDLANNDLIYYAFSDPCIIEGMVYTNANMSQVPGDRITISRSGDSDITGPIMCLYGASAGSIYGLSLHLDYSALRQVNVEDDDLEACTPNIDYTSMYCPSTWWLEPLLNGGNASFDSISAVMSRMADAITNQLRMDGTDFYGKPSNVTDTAFQTVVCTQFQWAWLLFPAIVVLASAVRAPGRHRVEE